MELKNYYFRLKATRPNHSTPPPMSYMAYGGKQIWFGEQPVSISTKAVPLFKKWLIGKTRVEDDTYIYYDIVFQAEGEAKAFRQFILDDSTKFGHPLIVVKNGNGANINTNMTRPEYEFIDLNAEREAKVTKYGAITQAHVIIKNYLTEDVRALWDLCWRVGLNPIGYQPDMCFTQLYELAEKSPEKIIELTFNEDKQMQTYINKALVLKVRKEGNENKTILRKDTISKQIVFFNNPEIPYSNEGSLMEALRHNKEQYDFLKKCVDESDNKAFSWLSTGEEPIEKVGIATPQIVSQEKAKVAAGEVSRFNNREMKEKLQEAVVKFNDPTTKTWKEPHHMSSEHKDMVGKFQQLKTIWTEGGRSEDDWHTIFADFCLSIRWKAVAWGKRVDGVVDDNN